MHIVSYYEAVQHLRPRSPHLSHLTHQWSCLCICLCLCICICLCICLCLRLCNAHGKGQDHVLDKSATFVLLFVHNNRLQICIYTVVKVKANVIDMQDVEGGESKM